VLNRRSPGSGPGGFIFFKQPGLTGMHQAAKQRRLFAGHHCSSSGMNRISTVRRPGETVANRHELCPRWRYGDSRLGHGVSRRRAGVSPIHSGRTTVWQGSSRCRLRWSYGMTTVQAGGRQLNYRNSILIIHCRSLVQSFLPSDLSEESVSHLLSRDGFTAII